MAHIDQVRSAPFSSILFADAGATADLADRAEPACFHDLNLDQVVSSLTSGREDYDLTPFFYTPLADRAAISYRHEVLRDLDRAPLLEHVESFARKMRLMRERIALADKLHYKYQKQRWYLDAVATYCEAATELAAELRAAELTSQGFLSLREYLAAYLSSPSFRSLLADTTQLRNDLDQVHYSLHIKGNHIRVRRYAGEPDYSADVDRTFAKFKQHADKDYRVRLSDWPDMNHVEAGVLDLVAKLYPETFLTLEAYCRRYQGFVDDTIGRLDREIQFYVAYLEYLRPIRAAGLKFCYPKMSSESKEVHAYETFDLALARKLSLEGAPVVTNDFQLNEPERILVGNRSGLASRCD